MKKCLLCLVPFILMIQSCSNRDLKSGFRKSMTQEQYSLMCSEYKKNVIEKAFTDNNSKNQEEYPYLFIKDENKAKESLKRFNPNLARKFQNSPDEEICDVNKTIDESKSPYKCGLIFPEYKYLVALIHGYKHNNWSAELKKEIKVILKKYVLDISKPASTNFIDVILAIDLSSKAAKLNIFPSLSLLNFKNRLKRREKRL